MKHQIVGFFNGELESVQTVEIAGEYRKLSLVLQNTNTRINPSIYTKEGLSSASKFKDTGNKVEINFNNKKKVNLKYNEIEDLKIFLKFYDRLSNQAPIIYKIIKDIEEDDFDFT